MIRMKGEAAIFERPSGFAGLAWPWALWTALLMVLAPTVAETRAVKSSTQSQICPTAGTQAAKVTRVDERLDLALADGSVLHLAGIDPPLPTAQAPDRAQKAQDALAAQIGAGITFLPLAPKPDRWGRIAAFVFLSPDANGAARQAATFLLEGGFARFMPTPETHGCHAAFLSSEEKARHAKLGLWLDPYYAIIAATNRTAFVDKAANNVIVEGRIVDVSSNEYRTTVEFAARREHAFTVTILKRNVAIFERSGLDFKALIGRNLRVRGLLDLRFGPQIEIKSPDDIELISNEQEQGAIARQGTTDAEPKAATDR